MAIQWIAGDIFTCLSGDTKSTLVPANTKAVETDTDDTYKFNGTSWVLFDANDKTETLTNKTVSNDSNTFPYVGAYNAIIYKSGSLYKSKRGDGTLLASSTTLDTVVQAALDERGLILWPEAASRWFYQPSNVAAWTIHEYTRLIMACNILVSSAYASTLFTIDDDISGGLTQKWIFIDGGYITQAGATPSQTWTGIDLKSHSNNTSGGSGGITACKFSNIWMNKPGTGIKLTALTGDNSWINGNIFDMITVANCHIGFDFNTADDHPTNHSAHRNTFINCIAQANSNLDDQSQGAMIYGFHDITGRQNTFYHCQGWDTTDSNISCNIKSTAMDTCIHGGLMVYKPIDWEITQDLGVRTVVFPMESVHSAAGWNAGVTNPFLKKTGTWSGYCGTGPTASVGDGLLNAMGTTTGATGVYSKPTPTSDGQPAMMDTGGTANVPVGFRTQTSIASRYFNPFYKCRFKLNQTTAQRIFVGFASTTTVTIGTADDPLVSLSGYGLYHSTTHGTSATNWLIARNNGGANSTFTNTGIAANITTPQTVITAGYEFTGASPPPPYFISRVGTNPASAKATTTIPAQFTEMNVGCWLSNPSGQKTCNVYSMFFKNGRPDPS